MWINTVQISLCFHLSLSLSLPLSLSLSDQSFIVTVMSIGETAQVGGAFLLEVCGLPVVVSVTVLVIMIPYDEVVALPRRDVIGTVSLCAEMNHSKPSFVRIPC